MGGMDRSYHGKTVFSSRYAGQNFVAVIDQPKFILNIPYSPSQAPDQFSLHRILRSGGTVR